MNKNQWESFARLNSWYDVESFYVIYVDVLSRIFWWIKKRSLLIPVKIYLKKNSRYFEAVQIITLFNWAISTASILPRFPVKPQKPWKYMSIEYHAELGTNTNHSVDLINLSLAVCIYLVRERKLIALNFIVYFVCCYSSSLCLCRCGHRVCSVQNNKLGFHHLTLDQKFWNKTTHKHRHIFGDLSKIFILLRRGDSFPTAISKNSRVHLQWFFLFSSKRNK